MTKSSVKLLGSFERKLKVFELTRKKQEALFSDGKLVLRDIEEVYASLFLGAVVSFEGMIEELFLGLLTGKIRSRCSNVNVRVKIKSDIVARDVVLRGRKYYNWLPYENTKNIANIFFTGGRPFTLLAKDKESHIDKCLTIRHAIAHKSRHAVKKFKDEVLEGLSLMPRERRPKSFLRAQFSASPSTIYYVQLMAELFNIANDLC